MGNQPSSMSTTTIYNDIKNYHDQAYRTIEQAISLEEQERSNDAIEKYKEGIMLIHKCLDTPITFPENPDQNWDDACRMIQKMKKTRGEVLTRINCIQASPDYLKQIPPPPTYEEAMASSSTRPQTYNELANALNNIEATSYSKNAEIIYTHDNVKMYYIAPDGNVLSTSEPQTLNILLVDGEEETKPKAFLQIGDFVYPLVAGVSPCYRTDYGAFILPDVHNEKPEYSIGIILPSDADADVYELLENILHGIVNQTPIDPTYKRKSISGTISNGLVAGAFLLSNGLIKGAKKTGDLISSGTPRIINNIAPNAEATNLPPNLRKSLKFAQKATSTTATVTGFVADKIGTATTRLGRYLAPHIKKQGTRLLTSGFKFSEEEASNKVDDVFVVAAGAVEGFSTVYRGLESSASILGQSLKQNSVKIIEHKYGNTCGEAANDTMDTVGNCWNISNSAKILTPKGLAKHTMKETGKALGNQQSNNCNSIMYPSTSGVNNVVNNVKDSKDVLKK